MYCPFPAFKQGAHVKLTKEKPPPSSVSSMAPSYQSDIESEPKVGGIKELIQLWSRLEAIETPFSSNRHRRKSAVTDWGDVIRDLQKVVQRLLAERSNEVQVLKNKQLVSMFLHRKKIEVIGHTQP